MHQLAIITESTSVDIGLVALIITAIIGATMYLAKRDAAGQVSEARLASAIESLTAELGRVNKTLGHLDDRVNEHDTKIALIEQRQKDAA